MLIFFFAFYKCSLSPLIAIQNVPTEITVLLHCFDHVTALFSAFNYYVTLLHSIKNKWLVFIFKALHGLSWLPLSFLIHIEISAPSYSITCASLHCSLTKFSNKPLHAFFHAAPHGPGFSVNNHKSLSLTCFRVLLKTLLCCDVHKKVDNT